MNLKLAFDNYTPCNEVAGVLCFRPVRPSVRLSVRLSVCPSPRPQNDVIALAFLFLVRFQKYFTDLLFWWWTWSSSTLVEIGPMSRSQQTITLINLDACPNDYVIALAFLFLVRFQKYFTDILYWLWTWSSSTLDKIGPMSRSQQPIAIINIDACQNEDVIALAFIFWSDFKKYLKLLYPLDLDLQNALKVIVSAWYIC